MKKQLYLPIFLCILIACNTKKADNEAGSQDTVSNQISAGWKHHDSILSIISPPRFKCDTFDIKRFGAKGDGETDCTEAIKQAIDSCNQAGGGVVKVPGGTFLTGAIHLKNNVNLHVSKDAILLFSTDKSKYLPVVFSRFEGMECMNYSPFVYAYQQENIAITGQGVLDGQGQVWWNWKGKWGGSIEHGWKEGNPNQHSDNEMLTKMVEDTVPVSERIFGNGHYLRPSFIQPYQCKNILIEGITLKNSPMWIIHPVLSENITIQNLRIESLGPNNDGCDPECCKNVLIKNCFFDTGDDCIALKSGRNNDGRRVGRPIENVIIKDCTMKEGHGGVVIGSEISGNARYIFAENCEMDSPHLDRALRIKSNSLRGGTVEHVYLKNITVNQVREAPVKINLFYSKGRGEHIPQVNNIFVENMTSRKSRYAIWIKAYENMPVKGIYLKNCSFDGVKEDVMIENVEQLNVENVAINGKPYEGI